MKNKKTLLFILTAVLLLISVALILLGQDLLSVISAALSCVPLFILSHIQEEALNNCRRESENYSKALEIEKAHHAEELKRVAASSKEELEDFRSVLSHQLRMPLSIVQGYADILIKGMVADEAAQKEYLGKIVDRTQYISDLLSNQLSIHRNVDEIVPVFEKIDLVSLIKRAGEDMQTVAKNQGVSIQCVSALDSLIIEADDHQLNKVIFNIIENSLKYMGREGHITLLIDADSTNATITIRDDGMGLDSEETAHIFELNYQGSNKVNGRGHGHGLYLAQRATEVHGGTISASSAPGMGMAIKITLPISQPVKKASAEADSGDKK